MDYMGAVIIWVSGAAFSGYFLVKKYQADMQAMWDRVNELEERNAALRERLEAREREFKDAVKALVEMDEAFPTADLGGES